MNAEQIQAAYSRWFLRHYEARDVDKGVTPFLDDSIASFAVGKKSWLRDVRRALFLSAETVARELGISRSAYAKLEKSEMSGNLTLGALAKAAAAMDCELVYGIRSKKRLKYSQMIWKILKGASVGHHWVLNRPQIRKVEALAAVAQWKMHDPKFRRDQGWSQRKR